MRILFVGAFGEGKSPEGHTGGQLFACRSLLSSALGQKYDWLLIDSMASTNKRRSWPERLSKAVFRLFGFGWKVFRADVVLLFCSAGFSFTEKGLMALWAKLLGKPVILAPRSGLMEEDIRRSVARRRFVARVVGAVDVLLCQSPFWKNFYSGLARGVAGKCVCLPNWIDARPYVQNRPGFEKRLESQRLKVLFLGWITRNKGVFNLVELAAILGEEAPDFFLAGDGEDMDALRSAIAEKGVEERIHLLGWIGREEKLAWLKTADVFILPSYRDGYPNALLEAMASGLACVASKTGGIPDMIRHGESGLLVEPGELGQWAKALHLLSRDVVLRKCLGKAARERVLKNNSLSEAVKVFEDLFSRLGRKMEKHDENT